MNLPFQLKKMVRSLQYRVAFLISSLCVCVALLLETWKNRGVDRFAAYRQAKRFVDMALVMAGKSFLPYGHF